MSGQTTTAVQSHAENLLDIDFDGAAPASLQKAPLGGASGLEGLAGTPMRVASPSNAGPAVGGMEDLMGIFGNDSGSGSNGAAPAGGSGSDDLLNGFASMNMTASQPPPPQTQLDGGGKKNNEDILGLF